MKTFSKQKAHLDLGSGGPNVDYKISNILEPSMKKVRFFLNIWMVIWLRVY
jgi:hypothetical protein